MSDEILTVQEVAALLTVADKTVYTMALRGSSPASKVRGQWRRPPGATETPTNSPALANRATVTGPTFLARPLRADSESSEHGPGIAQPHGSPSTTARSPAARSRRVAP